MKCPIPLERIQDMIATLESGIALRAAMRKEIVDALDCLYITLLIERDKSQLGRRRSPVQELAAHDVHLLVEHHHATVKSALRAVLRDGDERALRALERCYQKMTAATRFEQFRQSESQEERIRKLAALTRQRQTPKQLGG